MTTFQRNERSCLKQKATGTRGPITLSSTLKCTSSHTYVLTLRDTYIRMYSQTQMHTDIDLFYWANVMTILMDLTDCVVSGCFITKGDSLFAISTSISYVLWYPLPKYIPPPMTYFQFPWLHMYPMLKTQNERIEAMPLIRAPANFVFLNLGRLTHFPIQYVYSWISWFHFSLWMNSFPPCNSFIIHSSVY